MILILKVIRTNQKGNGKKIKLDEHNPAFIKK